MRILLAAFALATIYLHSPRVVRATQPPTACFGTVDINVCYTPWKVTQAEPGYNGVVMRKGPFPDADPIWNINTDQAVVIPINAHFGRCSLRDGGVANNCPDPGLRPAVNGFVWGYYLGYGKQGWIRWQVGGSTYSVADPNFSSTLCGPASFDFDCRYAHSACTQYHGCGGSPQPNSACSDATYHPIIVVGTTLGDLSQEKYYLRYGGDSTTFGWFVPGDTVKRHCTASVSGFTWSCVVVECARYLPNGCRGWVRSDALGPAMYPGDVEPCFPELPCPVGSDACHSPADDADGDGDVDQVDFGVFQKCMSGEGGGIAAGCECFDRDNGGAGDGDVDAADFAIFNACFSGPEIPADVACDR